MTKSLFKILKCVQKLVRSRNIFNPSLQAKSLMWPSPIYLCVALSIYLSRHTPYRCTSILIWSSSLRLVAIQGQWTQVSLLYKLVKLIVGEKVTIPIPDELVWKWSQWPYRGFEHGMPILFSQLNTITLLVYPLLTFIYRGIKFNV